MFGRKDIIQDARKIRARKSYKRWHAKYKQLSLNGFTHKQIEYVFRMEWKELNFRRMYKYEILALYEKESMVLLLYDKG